MGKPSARLLKASNTCANIETFARSMDQSVQEGDVALTHFDRALGIENAPPVLSLAAGSCSVRGRAFCSQLLIECQPGVTAYP